MVIVDDSDETTSSVVKAYSFSATASSSSVELTPVEYMEPPSKYLSQHTAMLRVCGSLPLSITTPVDGQWSCTSPFLSTLTQPSFHSGLSNQKTSTKDKVSVHSFSAELSTNDVR